MYVPMTRSWSVSSNFAANVERRPPCCGEQVHRTCQGDRNGCRGQNGEILAYAIRSISSLPVFIRAMPPYNSSTKLYVETVRRIKRVSRQIANALHINGPFNIQYMARENDILVIECNLRASRSFPFVSKVLKLNLIDLATKVMLGVPVEKPGKNLFDLDYVGIKASQFSFNRLQKADPVLGVDMASTGEVGCLATIPIRHCSKSMLSVGHRIPKQNILLSTGGAKQKAEMLDAAGCWSATATNSSPRAVRQRRQWHRQHPCLWPSEEDQQPQALTMLHEKKIDMVVNIPKNLTVHELTNGYKIRRAAIDLNIPLITNSRLASSFINAFCTLTLDDIDIKAWAEYK